jgi:hypothetical protein
MLADLTLSAIPDVLQDYELSFVLGFAPDARRCFKIDGAEYRRGSDRVMIDWSLGAVHLRAFVVLLGGATYLMASAGPFLNDWWPMLQRAGGDSARPLLSAGVAGVAQAFRTEDVSIKVAVVPPVPEVPSTNTAMGITQTEDINDGILRITHRCSLGVIKATLMLLQEYRALLPSVPDVDVELDGVQLSLETLLDTASEAAEAISWTHSPG